MATEAAGDDGKAGLVFRAVRGAAWMMFGYASSQALRLGANLILTRILFPEAFGVMALVTVFIVGLAMFSDVGIGPSISQSKRGDDPDFLNTAWTIQVLRGFGLFAVSCLISWPVAVFYGEPMLAWLLPAAGATLVVAGFNPTKIETAHRHLIVDRVTRLDIQSQMIGIFSMIALAWAMQSVVALVLGNLVTSFAYLILMRLGLPGDNNHLRWEPEAGRELLHFGKWIFASTLCGFFTSQGDRAILGKALSLSMLGVYNIGFFLASFPLLLGYAVTGRVLIPVYRESREDPTAEVLGRIRWMRFGLTAGLLTLVLVFAFVGVPLVALLYDPRYASAGAIVVLVACIQIPKVIGMSYDQAALAAGDSKGFFLLSLARATVLMGLMLWGALHYGLIGALAGMGAAAVIAHPMIVVLAIKHEVWDPLHDILFASVGLAFGGIALWLNWPQILLLI